MSSYGFRERILEISEDGPALANSTAQASLLPTSKKTAGLPIGFFDRLGNSFEFMFCGRISNIVTSPGTLQLAIRLGAIDVFLSGAMPLNVVAKTDVHWRFSGELICRAIGAGTATLLFPKGCRFESHSVVGSPAPSAGGAGTHLLPYNAAPANGAGFDNGQSGVIDAMGQWSVANSGNSIQIQGGHIDVLI
jgi:hypothetical protein